MGKLCPTQIVLGTLLTYNCSNVAERQARLRAAQARWTVMGRFWSAECSLTASQTHYFPQHGLVDTPDRVGDSSAQPFRLQSFRQVHSLQGTQPHAGKRQVVAGLTQREKRDTTRLPRQKSLGG